MKEYIKEWNAAVVSIKEIREMDRPEIVKEAFIQDMLKDLEDRAPEAV
jgi:hypothetical protein